MFIGLIFDVLLLIFFIVAVLLVFSLLLASVETKAFEFGVMRLVGLTKSGFVGMVLMQASMFVLPAVILAFTLSFPFIAIIYSVLLKENLGYMPSVVPSWRAVFNALIIGLLIPLFSSIIPIRRGLNANLNETLDQTRSKSKSTIITLTNNKMLDTLPFLFQGALSVILGIFVYYGLPVALLEFNIELLLLIFFTLLFGMITGLVLIATNLQPSLERLFLYLFFFWETSGMRAVLKKNMVTHRRKNKLTAIIYSLSLGCIIFLLTTANVQMNFITELLTYCDADISVFGNGATIHSNGVLRPKDVDPIILKYADQLDVWGYQTEAVYEAHAGNMEVVSDLARLS